MQCTGGSDVHAIIGDAADKKLWLFASTTYN